MFGPGNGLLSALCKWMTRANADVLTIAHSEQISAKLTYDNCHSKNQSTYENLTCQVSISLGGCCMRTPNFICPIYGTRDYINLKRAILFSHNDGSFMRFCSLYSITLTTRWRSESLFIDKCYPTLQNINTRFKIENAVEVRTWMSISHCFASMSSLIMS